MAAKKKTAAKAKAGAARKPRARATAKVSPLRGMPVEAWVERVSGWQQQAVKKLLGLLKKAAPSATISIKWGQPVAELNGPFSFIKPAKAHVTIGFWRGADLKWPPGKADGAGNRMRHLKIGSLAAVDAALVVDLVKQAARLNELKGDPTKR